MNNIDYKYFQQANDLMEHSETMGQIGDAIRTKQESTKNVNVIVAGDNQDNWRVNPLNNFVILFYEHFQTIVRKNKLNNTDMLVLLELLKLMRMGNQVKITQKQIAKNIGKYKSQVSTCWNKFIKINLIIKTDDGSEYVNPQLIVKGSLKKQSESPDFDELSSKSKFKNYDKHNFSKGKK